MELAGQSARLSDVVSNMNLAWTLRNGGVCMALIKPAELPNRLKRLHRRGLDAVAWLDGQRDAPSGVVEINPDGKRIWWYYVPDVS